MPMPAYAESVIINTDLTIAEYQEIEQDNEAT